MEKYNNIGENRGYIQRDKTKFAKMVLNCRQGVGRGIG